MKPLSELYDFTGRTIVMTGGTGVLGREMALTLAASAREYRSPGRDPSKSGALSRGLAKQRNVHHSKADVLDKNALERAAEEIVGKFEIRLPRERSGGQQSKATTNKEQSFSRSTKPT
jgi:NAD(P)-dependent dehydrogenase (short-subunit alcohol dehydrogenase family)